MKVGGQVSVDLNPTTDVPIGFLFSFRQDQFVEGNSDITDRVRAFGVVVAFTGRSDFSIGLEGNYIWIPLLESAGSANAISGTINLRYYF